MTDDILSYKEMLESLSEDEIEAWENKNRAVFTAPYLSEFEEEKYLDDRERARDVNR